MNINKVQNVQPKPVSSAQESTLSKIGRHTIGRVSNAARIPINFFAALLQGVKIIAKTITLPVVFLVNEEFPIDDVVKDCVYFTVLLRATRDCFAKVIIAPSQSDAEFMEGCNKTYNTLIGRYSTTDKDPTYQKILIKTLDKASPIKVGKVAFKPEGKRFIESVKDKIPVFKGFSAIDTVAGIAARIIKKIVRITS